MADQKKAEARVQDDNESQDEHATVAQAADADVQAEATEAPRRAEYVVLSVLGGYSIGDVVDASDLELPGTKNNVDRLLRLGAIVDVDSPSAQAALLVGRAREAANSGMV